LWVPNIFGTHKVAECLGESGSYPAARDLSRLIAGALTEDDAYGPEHPDTLPLARELLKVQEARWQALDAAWRPPEPKAGCG